MMFLRSMPRILRPTSTLCQSSTQHFSFSSQSDRLRKKVKKTLIDTSRHDHPNADVRLSKRMSELGMCSRREAAKILKETTDATDMALFEQAIYLRGNPVTAGTGVKVARDEQMIEIRSINETNSDIRTTKFVPYDKLPWEKIKGDTIVLNKPIGYVSGQEEHQHIPAVRLLTLSNLHFNEGDPETKHTTLNSSSFTFTTKKWDFNTSSSLPKQVKNDLGLNRTKRIKQKLIPTLSGYATAGRLDIDSTGLLIFTRAGIMARHLISPDSKIPKEVSDCQKSNTLIKLYL